MVAEEPALTVRDQYQEAQTLRILHDSGILSPQTWSLKSGLDYEQEQKNLGRQAAAK